MNDDLNDQVRVCVDCGIEYVWSAGEQEHWRQRNLVPPKRCKPCRTRRRVEIERSGGHDAPRNPRERTG